MVLSEIEILTHKEEFTTEEFEKLVISSKHNPFLRRALYKKASTNDHFLILYREYKDKLQDGSLFFKNEKLFDVLDKKALLRIIKTYDAFSKPRLVDLAKYCTFDESDYEAL